MMMQAHNLLNVDESNRDNVQKAQQHVAPLQNCAHHNQ